MMGLGVHQPPLGCQFGSGLPLYKLFSEGESASWGWQMKATLSPLATLGSWAADHTHCTGRQSGSWRRHSTPQEPVAHSSAHDKDIWVWASSEEVLVC